MATRLHATEMSQLNKVNAGTTKHSLTTRLQLSP